jgi:hypothetical protein
MECDGTCGTHNFIRCKNGLGSACSASASRRRPLTEEDTLIMMGRIANMQCMVRQMQQDDKETRRNMEQSELNTMLGRVDRMLRIIKSGRLAQLTPRTWVDDVCAAAGFKRMATF